MRILHLTDFHFRQPWFAWAAKVAPDYDLVALTGDLLRCLGSSSTRTQTRWLKAWIAEFPGRLALCSGNHDEPADWLHAVSRPNLLVDGGHMHLGSWTIESVGWGKMPTMGGPRHITLIHCPPAQSATAISWYDGSDWGDFELGQWLATTPAQKRPRLILSGHEHTPLRWHDCLNGTWSFNPGIAIHGEVPRRIVIDLATGVAERLGPDIRREQVQWAR